MLIKGCVFPFSHKLITLVVYLLSHRFVKNELSLIIHKVGVTFYDLKARSRLLKISDSVLSRLAFNTL